MAGKKKSKSSKLARMSDEERARYLQHRAELELEAKRRKQQLIAVFTKNKLKREEAFSRLNTAKINEQWRFILRKIKCKELHQNVEYLWTNFDRLMKVKDEIIQRLYNELKVADTDHRRLQEAHIEIMDAIMGKYKQRLTYLHTAYMYELEDIKSNDVIALGRLRRDMEENSEQVESIVSKNSKLLEGKISTTRTYNAVNLHNVLYLKEDITSGVIHQTSMELERLWEQLNEVITDYETTTENKRKQYEYLKEQDDAHQSEIADYPKLSLQLQSTVDTLKRNTETLSERRGERIKQLKAKTIEMKQRTEDIRQELTVSQIVDSLQLKKLSVTSNNTLKELREISERGSTILQFIKMCSNLEPMLFNLRKYFVQATVPIQLPTVHVSKPFDKLDNFWEQYNYVKAENIFLKKEYDKLSLENKQLRRTLRMYLVTVSGIPVSRPFTSISI